MKLNVLAQISIGEFTFVINSNGNLYFHNDTIPLEEAKKIVSIHSFLFYNGKIYKLKINDYFMTMIKEGEDDVSFKGSGELLSLQIRKYLNSLTPNNIRPIAFEGIYSEYSTPGENYGRVRTNALIKLFIK
jgi:hypothetical protein